MKKFSGFLYILENKYNFKIMSENVEIAKLKLSADPLKYITDENMPIMAKPKNIRFNDKEGHKLTNSFVITCPKCGVEAIEYHFSDDTISLICFGRCI